MKNYMTKEMIENLTIIVGEYPIKAQQYPSVIAPLVRILNGLATGALIVTDAPADSPAENEKVADSDK